MRIEEAAWIAGTLRRLRGARVVLNLGSGSRRFREVSKPHIDREIFRPLAAAGARIVHADLKAGDGVDVSGDLFDPAVQHRLRALRADAVLACNILEHLEPALRERFPAILDSLLAPGGVLVLTVPYSYPYHADPIDTLYRPSPDELCGLFPRYEVLGEKIVDSSSYGAEFVAGGPLRMARKVVRMLFPFVRPRRWLSHAHRMLWLFRPYRVSGVVLRRALVVLAALLVAAAVADEACAEPRPQWEFGLGAVGLRLPDYRGSDESRNYVYPLPYFIYRGDVLRVDREGARARFFQLGRAELDFSVNATPPVHSEDNRARQGMPDLDPTIEIGPMLNISLVRDRARERRLDLRLPLRAVIATDLRHAHTAGFVFYPHLSSGFRLGSGWNLGLQAGPLFATARYHEYFYGIAPEFATAERPAYTAGGGYSGAVALASLSRRVGRFWVGGFTRYDALQGTAFEGSPLVKRDHSLMAGVAFAWVFAESARRVDVLE